MDVSKIKGLSYLKDIVKSKMSFNPRKRRANLYLKILEIPNKAVYKQNKKIQKKFKAEKKRNNILAQKVKLYDKMSELNRKETRIK